jgi:rare lipoprotein A (peptidoglycan hydrolase)
MKNSLFLSLRLACITAASIAITAASTGCTAKRLETRTDGVLATPTERVLKTQTGVAAFYGAIDDHELFAAHPSYPRGTIVRVTNLENGLKTDVRIRDRGPTAVEQAKGIIIDLSRAAARDLDFIKEGKARVRVEVLDWGKDRSR